MAVVANGLRMIRSRVNDFSRAGSTGNGRAWRSPYTSPPQLPPEAILPMRSDDEFARRLQRLSWDCRRGMKETEVMLSPFRVACFDALDRAGQEAFLDLLDCEDADLFAWFTSADRPADPAVAAMIDRVLAHAAANP